MTTQGVLMNIIYIYIYGMAILTCMVVGYETKQPKVISGD